MKSIIPFIITCIILFSQRAYALENEPRFPGCDDPADEDCADMKMMQFVFSNLKHPDGNPGGEVVASFVVKASGEITKLAITHSITPDCDEEVIRILNLMPKWLPALENGKAVDMEWALVVKFIAKK